MNAQSGSLMAAALFYIWYLVLLFAQLHGGLVSAVGPGAIRLCNADGHRQLAGAGLNALALLGSQIAREHHILGL